MKNSKREFFGECMHVGFAGPVRTTERGYPTEFSAVEYLAIATRGQEIGVGDLSLVEQVNETLRRHYSAGVVFVPDVGIWLCEPVFDDAAEAMERVRCCVDLVEAKLGQSISELPIDVALVAVVEDVQPDLRGVDPLRFYDTEIYTDVAGALGMRRGRNWDSSRVAETMERLLDVGFWLDMKERLPDCAFRVPAWLAERIDAQVVATDARAA